MTCRYIVEGRVQGVGFRYFVMRTAGEFDVGGGARNLADGSVEIMASGTRQNLLAFREQIEIGPRHARVDRVIAEEMPEQRFAGFSVL